MSYTVGDLDAKVLELFGNENRWNTEDQGWDRFEYFKETLELDGIGIAETVDSFGGEGQGDDYYVVVKVTAPDGSERTFKRNGYHVSHDGSYLDGPTVEVKSVQKTVTVWE